MVYAVVDTNVLVAALWTRNTLAATKRVLDLLLAGEIVPLYNAEVVQEYRDVLNRTKFPFDAQEVDDLIGFIMEIGVDTERTKYDELMPDEDDRVFYEISLTVEDSFLVTGNLKHYPKVPKVVTPAELIELLHV